jgi:1,4-dihydroxy-2-naphthoyl-CoA hydrolase
MFKAQTQVRMHDTDMAGVIFFANQFRFAHDALEDFVESEGFSFEDVFHKNDFVFLVVHAEADYLAPLRVGQSLEVEVSVERIGTTSFTVFYRILDKRSQNLVGTVKTIHVTLDRNTREKIAIPQTFREILEKHT